MYCSDCSSMFFGKLVICKYLNNFYDTLGTLGAEFAYVYTVCPKIISDYITTGLLLLPVLTNYTERIFVVKICGITSELLMQNCFTAILKKKSFMEMG